MARDDDPALTGRNPAALVPIRAGPLIERRADGVCLLLGKRVAGRTMIAAFIDQEIAEIRGRET